MVYFAKKKIKCIGYDINKEKVKKINSGTLPLKDLRKWFGFDIRGLVKQNYLKATSNYENLITKEFQIPKERLSVSVYSEDKEAFDLWKKIAGLPESRIYKISTSDNFWSMGDLGPCGPCSVIFYDYGQHLEGGPPVSKDQDGDRFI